MILPVMGDASFDSQPLPGESVPSGTMPVLILGAGLSGLVLAHTLDGQGIPYRIFDREPYLGARGSGWGLTLNWALPALQELLPGRLGSIEGILKACVDRRSVEAGRSSLFPFYDISSGQQKSFSPLGPGQSRLRVTREKLRQLLSAGIHIEWNKELSSLEEHDDSVSLTFTDGSMCRGTMLVACDGGQSKVRQILFPDTDQNTVRPLPIRMMGVKADFTAEQVASLRDLDPYFMQGTSSENNNFAFFSILDSPNNFHNSTPDRYTLQICTSWLFQDGYSGLDGTTDVPTTNEERLALLKRLASSWADPWRALVMGLPETTEVVRIKIQDWAPPIDFHTSGRTVLMGDAFHLMTMYRGEGANHAVVDVLDFYKTVIPGLRLGHHGLARDLRTALDNYEKAVISRSRPGVFASRRATLDAHDWARISDASPLLSKRDMYITSFGEDE